VLTDLEGRIDLLLDAGPTQVGVESTVISLISPTPTLLRPGGTSLEALRAVLGDLQMINRISPDEAPLASPGILEQHYAPHAQVTLFQGSPTQMRVAMVEMAAQLLHAGEAVGLLIAEEDAAQFAPLPVQVQVLGSASDLPQVAQRLFAALRALDDAGVAVILARDFGSSGLGLAIRDRLTRAAAGRVITFEAHSS
jgi:L-threonylcarbamoyladenylate synthase